MDGRLTTNSGQHFHCHSMGSEDAGRTIIALHGFGGSGLDFSHLAERLPAARWLVPDWFGHGRSPLAGQAPGAVLDLQLELLDAAVRSSTQPVDLLAYSMGARIALNYLVSKKAAKVSSAFLIGVSPGVEGDVERRQRLAADRRWAALLRRAGVAAFREKWRRQPVLASRLDPQSSLERRLEVSRMRHDPWGLAACIDGMSPGRVPSLWPAIPSVRTPLTLVVGEEDQKFLAINLRMREELKSCRLEVIPGSGHAVHLDNPDALAGVLAACWALPDRRPRC